MNFTNAILDIANNCYFYFGDFISCSELEFSNDRYLLIYL